MVFLSCSLLADSFVSEEGFPPPWKATISGLTQLAGDEDSCTTSFSGAAGKRRYSIHWRVSCALLLLLQPLPPFSGIGWVPYTRPERTKSLVTDMNG